MPALRNIITASMVACGIIFCSQALFAQSAQYVFRHFTAANGLSSNQVRCIFQDQRGFIWFGTEEGLTRYDGVNTVIYRHSSGNSISNNHVNCITEDKKGNLWIGTQKGLNRLNISDGSVSHFLSEQDSALLVEAHSITALTCDTHGTLWAGTNSGLLKYMEAKDSFIFVLKTPDENRPGQLADVAHHGIAFDNHHTMYVAIGGEIYFSSNSGSSFHPLSLHHLQPAHGKTSIAAIDIFDDELWYSTWHQSGIFICKLSEGVSAEKIQHQTFLPAHSGVSEKTVDILLDFCQAYSHEVWAGGQGGGNFKEYGGLFIIDRDSKNIINIRHDPVDQNSLSSNDITFIFKDRQGTVWIATDNNGVDYHNPAFSSFSNYSFHPKKSNSLPSGILAAICEDAHGTIWVGSYESGIAQFDEANQQFIQYTVPVNAADGNQLNITWKLFADKYDTLWISTQGGLIQFDLTKKNFITRNGRIKKITDKVVTDFAEDNEGNLWMSFWRGGLMKYDFVQKNFSVYSAQEKNTSHQILKENFHCLTIDSGNNLWAGGRDGTGLFQFSLNNGAQNMFSYPSITDSLLTDGTVTSLCVADYGTIWIGTLQGGLIHYDQQTKKHAHFNIDKGLPGESIAAIGQASDHSLWITTTNGLSHFNPRTKNFSNYYTQEGLPENSFNIGALLISSQQKIYAGCNESLIVFDPKSFSRGTDTTPVEFVNLKIAGDDRYVGDWSMPLGLRYWQNNFSIEYSSMNFINPPSDQFEYLLTGYDRDWVNSGNRRYVNYTNLQGGDYIFKVRRLGSISPVSELKFHVATVFYKTAWFFVLSVLAVACILYVIYRVRINQVKRIYALRTKISRDLHDEIGSTLSSINIYSDLAKKQLASSNTELPAIEKIGRHAREVISTMRDIIWAIDPGNDEFGKIIERMENLAFEQLSPKNISVEFEADEKLNHKLFPFEVTKSIYFLFKEAINNIAKHAAAKRVTIKIFQETNTLRLLIADDGNGFDVNSSHEGNGIRNMQERAREAGGSLVIRSTNGKGTEIFFEMMKQSEF